MNVSDAKRLKELELENSRFKRLLAESMLEKRGLEKKVVSAPSRGDLVRYLIDKGLSERKSLRFVGMSPSAYGSTPCFFEPVLPGNF